MLYLIGKEVNNEIVFLREDWETEKADAYSDDLGYAKVFESKDAAEKVRGSDEVLVPVDKDEDGDIFLL